MAGPPALVTLMVRLARQGSRVLRIKGGDGYIFDRGGEEAQVLARPQQTVVIYMGLGTLPEQRCITGSLRDLPTIAQSAELKPPTLMVIGEVVNLHAALAPAQVFAKLHRSMTTTPENPLQVHSNDVHASRFAPHGEFRIWTEGDILCYDATGPFNLEALQALAAARVKIVQQWKPGRRIAALVHWHKSALMSPEAFAAYGQGLERFHESVNLPVALAWVASPDVEGMQLMINKFEELFARRKTNFRLFADLDAARAWVNECLTAVNGTPST